MFHNMDEKQKNMAPVTIKFTLKFIISTNSQEMKKHPFNAQGLKTTNELLWLI